MIVPDRASAENLLTLGQRSATLNGILGCRSKVAENPRAHEAGPALATSRYGTVQEVHGFRPACLRASDHRQIMKTDSLESLGAELSGESQCALGMGLCACELACRAKHVAGRIVSDDLRPVMPDLPRQFDRRLHGREGAGQIVAVHLSMRDHAEIGNFDAPSARCARQVHAAAEVPISVMSVPHICLTLSVMIVPSCGLV